jgi:RNA polymerase sigma-70 factor (ECF subfamily)
MTTANTSMPIQHLFDQLFRNSRKRAYNLAYRLTGNATDAEDVTQDAYLRAWCNFGAYDANRSFERWLFRIITNRALDLYRRKKRVQIYSLNVPMQTDADGTPMDCEFIDPAAGPEETVLAPIVEEQLEAALLKLPADYRIAIVLCDVEQLSYLEIATRTRCATGTVRSRIHRARRLLRRYMEIGGSICPAGTRPPLSSRPQVSCS